MKIIKKFTNLILAITFILINIVCLTGTLDAKASSASWSFSISSMANNSVLRDSDITDSLFFIDINKVKVEGNFIYIYDESDKTIKVIDKTTMNYRAVNDHYIYEGLQDFIVFENTLLLLNNDENKIDCFNAIDFSQIKFESQNLLETIKSAKTIKIIQILDKNYLILCPTNPTESYFEIAEIKKETVPISGTETEDIISISNLQTFKIDPNWSSNNILNDYENIFFTNYNNSLFIMLLSNNKLYSFLLDPTNIVTNQISTITIVNGVDNATNLKHITSIKIGSSEILALQFDNTINFYNLNIVPNVSASLEINSDYQINLIDFSVTDIYGEGSTLALISGQKQALKVYEFSNGLNNDADIKNVDNAEIQPYLYSNTEFKYVTTTVDTPILQLPYYRDSLTNITEGKELVIIGEGRYESGESIFGWNYCMYTEGSTNYYGYVDSINLVEKEQTSFNKNYVTALGYTKLYSKPSVFTDEQNIEIKSIQSSSRLEVISSICDYNSNNISFLLVKVNGEDVGFIDKSRVLTAVNINDKVIPNATVMRDNSEIFTSTNSDKEIILYLNKGDRVKVVGKRDTKTNYTLVTFNDNEGNEYTGYIYTHNLEPDSWSMLQIIGMFLVAINVILLVIIICIKNKVTR